MSRYRSFYAMTLTLGLMFITLAGTLQAQQSKVMSKNDFDSFVLAGSMKYNASRKDNPSAYYGALVTLNEIVKNNPSLSQAQTQAVWNALDAPIQDATVSDFGSFLLGAAKAVPQLGELGIKLPLFDKLAKLGQKADAVQELAQQLVGEPHLASDEELESKAGEAAYSLISLAKRPDSNPLIRQAVDYYIRMINGSGSVTDDARQTGFNTPDYAHVINDLGLLNLQSSDGSAPISQKVIDALTSKFGKSFQDILAISAAIQKDVQQQNTDWKDVPKWIQNINDRQQKAEDDAKKAAAYQQKLDVAKTGVYLLSTFVGFGNPRLGQEIGVVGGAAIKGVTAVKAILEAGSLFSVGGFVAAGSLVEAGMDIFSLFNEKQSVDQVILAQIQAIREDIQHLGQIMNERFDHVDMELNQIFSTLETHFAQIDYQLGVIHETLSDVQISLLNIQTQMDRLETNLYGFLNTGFRMDFLEAINGGLRFQERAGLAMPFYPDYINYENKFNAWASIFGKDDLRAGSYQRSYADADILQELTVFPLPTNVNYILQSPSALFGLPALASDRVDNPRDWSLAANAYATLGEENPQDAWQIADYRFDEVYNEGLTLQDSLRRITQIGARANYPLFNALLGFYGGKIGPVSDKINNDLLLEYKRLNNIADQVDLWGGVDQSLDFTPEHLRSGSVMTPWNSDAHLPAQLDLPDGMVNALPVPLKLAEALNLGKLTFRFSVAYPNWTELRIPEGHNQCQLQLIVYALWEGEEVARWAALCQFHAEGEAFGNDDWHITVDPANTDFTWDQEWIDFGDFGYWNIVITAPTRLFFDFGDDNFSQQIKNWYDGKAIEWWQSHASITLPAERGLIVTPANMSVQTGKIQQLHDKVAQALHDHQVGFYQKVVDNLSADTPLYRAASELSGAQLLTADFVALGMPRSLAGNDLLRAMLYGDQRVMDTNAIKDLYSAAIADLGKESSVPKVDVAAVATERASALSAVLAEILDSIDKGKFTEFTPIVEEAMSHLQLYKATRYIPTVADDSQQVRVTRGSITFDRSTGYYSQWLTLENIGGQVIDAPISLVTDFNLVGAEPVAALTHQDGETINFRPAHSPYVNVPVGSDNRFLPQQVAHIRLEYVRKLDGPINYTTRVIGGYGRR